VMVAALALQPGEAEGASRASHPLSKRHLYSSGNATIGNTLCGPVDLGSQDQDDAWGPSATWSWTPVDTGRIMDRFPTRAGVRSRKWTPC